jgi:D-beta-D-heptose 7-phosphate kinase/D-beta-D-heptose 1-phosphate adenosyltransferase
VSALVVIGDALLDRDLDGRAERLAPDAPVPVVDALESHDRAGGAGLAATLAAAAGHAVTLVCALGEDAAGARVRALLASAGVAVCDLGLAGATPQKVRVRAGGRALVRLDSGGEERACGPLTGEARAALAGADAVLVSDYGRGVAAEPTVRAALAGLGPAPIVWDPHPNGPDPVPGCVLVTPNAAEAARVDAAAGAGGAPAARAGRGSSGNAADAPAARAGRGSSGNAADAPAPRAGGGSSGSAADAPAPRAGRGSSGNAADAPAPRAGRGSSLALEEARARALRERWGAVNLAVTLGARGAILVRAGGPALAIPAPHVGAGDPCGAGDCFAATAAGRLATGALPSEAVRAAVAAASEFVAAGGASEWSPAGPEPREPDARALAARVREQGGTVVATGGCFDLLHAGHVRALEAARALGDCLIVCVNSDASVRRLKGADRPLVPETDRVAVLAALRCVDAVAVFDEDDPRAILRELRPHVWAKGGDYAAGELPEAATLAEWGGRAVVVPYVAGRSTSRLIEVARAG